IPPSGRVPPREHTQKRLVLAETGDPRIGGSILAEMSSERFRVTVPDEETWRRPSPRFRLMRRAEVAIVTAVVATAAGAPAGIAYGSSAGGIVAGAVAVLGVLAERFVQRRVRAWGYCERDDGLLVRRGGLVA